MGSHSVTCHPAEVTFQPLLPAEAGTRFVARDVADLIQRALFDGWSRPGVSRVNERLLRTRIHDERTRSVRFACVRITDDARLKLVRVIDGLRATAGQIVDVDVDSVCVLHRCASCVRVDRTVRLIVYMPVQGMCLSRF